MKFNSRQIVVSLFILVIISMLLGLFIYFQNVKSTKKTEEKIKAENKTYIKNIYIDNKTSSSVSPTTEVDKIISPTLKIVKPSITPLVKTPTPTEVVLVKNPSPTNSSSSNSTNVTGSVQASLSPTQINYLPNSGIIEGSVAIFSVSLMLMLFAFIF